MNFQLNDPFPFFKLDGRVLYLASENPHLFEIPVVVLRDYQWHDDAARDNDDDDVEIEVVDELHAQDVERMRAEPHPFGQTTTVLALANLEARERLAQAEPLTDDERGDFGDALDEFADFCDVVSEEVSNSEPLEAVLARPWPRSKSEEAARQRALAAITDFLPDEDVKALRTALAGTPLEEVFERVLAAADASA